MKFVYRYYLPFTVFITGGCVLVLEVVATRILAPYFGNTMYTVSSVLSIVLAALSAGYYLGGKLADKRPSKKLFFGIIFASGLGVLLAQGLQVLVLPAIGGRLSLTTGPLVAGLLLFFVPSFGLGMLSPFAIKLANMQRKKEGIGSIAGEMFFFSTMGSIAGSLAAGFVLIPRYPVSVIVVGTGAGLVVLGMVPLAYAKLGKRQWSAALALLFIGLLAASLAPPQVRAVYSGSGVYQHLMVIDVKRNGRPVRILYEDNSVAGGMYLDSDADIYSQYQKYYLLPEAVQGRAPKNTAIIGGGMYVAPRALLQTYPNVHVDAVEIEPSLPALSEQYFNLPKSPRLSHHITDGRRFLHDTPTDYDMIFSDVYLSLYSTPMHFTTKEFFQTAYNALDQDGIFIANIIDSLDNTGQSVLRSEVRTLQQVFPNVYVFATRGLATARMQNFVVVGHKSQKPIAFNAPQFTNSAYAVIRSLQYNSVPLTRLGANSHPVLTDDFAPVDNWMAALVRRQYQ